MTPEARIRRAAVVARQRSRAAEAIEFLRRWGDLDDEIAGSVDVLVHCVEELAKLAEEDS